MVGTLECILLLRDSLFIYFSWNFTKKERIITVGSSYYLILNEVLERIANNSHLLLKSIVKYIHK